jgi:hypothetical protein
VVASNPNRKKMFMVFASTSWEEDVKMQ